MGKFNKGGNVPKKKEELQRKLSGFDTQRNFVVDSSSINEENRTISFILVSEENEGERYDWWTDEVFIEKLDVNGARYERLKTFFKDHNRSVDSAIGRVENIRVEDGKLKADVVFGTDEADEKIGRQTPVWRYARHEFRLLAQGQVFTG